jgi:hypothetical protein
MRKAPALWRRSGLPKSTTLQGTSVRTLAPEKNCTQAPTRAALKLAEKGCAVFPRLPREKLPATPHGFKDATRDPLQIKDWWRYEPQFNIGIATGTVSKLFVIDIDGIDAEAELRKLSAPVAPQCGLLELRPANLARRIVCPHRYSPPHGKQPPFATLNHIVGDLGIPGESDTQQVGISFDIASIPSPAPPGSMMIPSQRTRIQTRKRKSVFKRHCERETDWCERCDDQSAGRCCCQPSRAIRVTQQCPKSRTRADQNQSACRGG